MIDLIIAYLALIVVILLFIIAFLTLYILYEHRKTLTKDKNLVVPLLTLKTNERSSGDHSNSAILSTTHKRMTKRLRYRPRTLFLRTQNSQGFLLTSTHTNKYSQQTLDQTTIHLN